MSRWWRLVIAAITVALIVWFASTIDRARLADAFAHAELWPILAGLAIPFACLGAKALAWRALLPHPLGLGKLWRYAIVATAGSALAPARAGELVRAWLLRRDGVTIGETAATAISEKALDSLAMFLVMLPLPFAVATTWIRTAVLVGFCVTFVALVIGALVSSRVPQLAALRSPRRVIRALLPLLVAWLFDLGLVELVLFAFGLDVPIAGVLVALLAVNLAIALPSTPAQVGAHEAGMVAGLSVAGVAPELALGVALVYHAIQVIPVVVTGLALEWRLVLS